MRFYTHQYLFYCGIDLHARSMYICILSHDDKLLGLHPTLLSLIEGVEDVGWSLPEIARISSA